MGNYKFRLSDMISKLKDMGRARKHSSKKQDQMMISQSQTASTTSKPSAPHHFYPRKSYYITRELIPSDKFYVSPTKTPRKSCKKPYSRNRQSRSSSSPYKVVTSSVSSGCNCRATLWTTAKAAPDDDSPHHQYSASSSDDDDDDQKPQEEFIRSDCNILTTDVHQSFDNMVSFSRSSCNCKLINPDDEANDDDSSKLFVKKFDKLQISDQLQLPPIITKTPPVQFNDMVKDIKKKESTKYPNSSAKFEEEKKGSVYVKGTAKKEKITVKESTKMINTRKFVVNSPGFKLRVNSPKIGSRTSRNQGHGRKSVSSSSSSSISRRSSLSDSSFAVVKSSFDPQRDFRESMVEMIMENNIRASKDLEDLLACYLSLNSDQYHHLIIHVFKQIWFDLTTHHHARFK